MTKTFSLQLILTSIFAFALMLVMPAFTQAATCTFDRNLDLGDIGADVQCLQQFLNNSGFPIATSGLGSTGLETTKYGSLTKLAVARWQAAQGISPASGFWGPATRAVYANLDSGSAPAVTSSPTPTTVSTSGSVLTRLMKAALKNALTEVENTSKMIVDANRDKLKTSTAATLQAQAQSNLFDAIFAFLDDEVNKAIASANVALDKTRDAQKAIGSGSVAAQSDDSDETYTRVEAYREIKDVEDELEEIEDEIKEEKADGEDVDQANDLFDEAEDKFKEAEDEYDDGNFLLYYCA